MALANKVYAIRSLNTHPAEWTVAQTKTTAIWYKQASDLPLPTTKQLLLTRFHDTMMPGKDAAVPVATAVMAPLPPQHPCSLVLLLHNKIGWEDHKSKNDATTTAKKYKETEPTRTPSV